MCGIAGIISNTSTDLIRQFCASIIHRGPDSKGFHSFKNVSLGHTRLAIQDLSTNGNQPMLSTDGRYVIIFNGEIYNHFELRKKFLPNYHFKSTSDTETLLYCYIKIGKEILNHLNGIFAFAILDKTTENLFIARDHFGVKPLYYYNNRENFIFGSEIKSFLSFKNLDRSLDYTSLVNYLYYLWCPGDTTPFLNVKKLEPGHYLEINLNEPKILPKKYYDIPFTGKYLEMSEQELVKELEKKLIAAVERQMLSDAPVGFFLSGGLDSSALVAFTRMLYPDKKIQCFTIQNEEMKKTEGFVDDYYYAEKVARYLKVDLEVVPSRVDIMNDFDHMIWHLDEPEADPAPLHIYNISKRAKEMGYKVLIGGAGGDDIFSGYRRHVALNFEKYFRFIPPLAGKIIKGSIELGNSNNPLIRRAKKLTQNLDKGKEERFLNYFGWLPENRVKSLFSEDVFPGIKEYSPISHLEKLLHNIPEEKSDLNKMLYLEMKTFLVDHNLNYSDKMSMACGVEIRVPFLDKELVEFSTQIPPLLKMKGKTTKYLFRKVMERHLPHEIIYRSKSGFGAPIRKWITQDLRGKIEDYLNPTEINKREIFNASNVWKLIEENQKGEIDASYSILCLLAIESWMKQFKDQ